MADRLKKLAEIAECNPHIKTALVEHINAIEQLITQRKKAGEMMNKSVMDWRKFLKRRAVEDAEVVKMIASVEDTMDRIKLLLDPDDDSSLANQIVKTQLLQCFMHDGMRIITYDSIDDMRNYVVDAKKLRRALRMLEKVVNDSDYFEEVKDWVADTVVKCYIVMAIDTVVALQLLPFVKTLVANVNRGIVIETQFTNRLRAFNVTLQFTFLEAKRRKCRTLSPFDDVLAQMKRLDNVVKVEKTFPDVNQAEYLQPILEEEVSVLPTNDLVMRDIKTINESTNSDRSLDKQSWI